ncbi:hypothetical protein Enr17x_34090 [Gimesia fumaroli]|uniref:Uncharacterized protein n=1 Tax=Gimesia fumaroli TaxID=2527976 RepID=A0A518IE31_9PLAN|nr:hypothetical protein Enr17x_34090 [Gimesia fumaroli]
MNGNANQYINTADITYPYCQFSDSGMVLCTKTEGGEYRTNFELSIQIQ